MRRAARACRRHRAGGHVSRWPCRLPSHGRPSAATAAITPSASRQGRPSRRAYTAHAVATNHASATFVIAVSLRTTNPLKALEIVPDCAANNCMRSATSVPGMRSVPHAWRDHSGLARTRIATRHVGYRRVQRASRRNQDERISPPTEIARQDPGARSAHRAATVNVLLDLQHASGAPMTQIPQGVLDLVSGNREFESSLACSRNRMVSAGATARHVHWHDRSLHRGAR